nr:hypothetical protein [Suaeda aralocaspica]
MALDWQNPNYFTTNQFHPFQPQHFEFQDSPLLETELLCFDPLPPTLFEFEKPLFTHPTFQELDFNSPQFEDYLVTPTNDFDSHFFDIDYPPQMQDIFTYDVDYPPQMQDLFSYDVDYPPQMQGIFTPAPKKQKLAGASAPFIPDIFAVPEFNHQTINPDYYHPHCDGGLGGGGVGCYYGGVNTYNEDCGMNYMGHCEDYSKVISSDNKAVSAQSKAARERRRKITEKTQELGKLIPGGHKMNTAEMFEAASKYVKFMQAQLGILQSINNLPQDGVKEAKLNNLPILTSSMVQEKLYGKEKCLVPLDVLSQLEQHCDSETISHQIRDLLH